LISLAFLLAASFDAAAMAQTSATLNALGPHPFGSPRNQAAAQFVAAKLKEGGLARTTVDEFNFEGLPGMNVVATLPGRTDRLLIVATHLDSPRDAQDFSGRSRSLALLIEVGRQAARLRPAKTWILAAFDGGESLGEGFAHYLSALGKNRSLIDGVVVLEAADLSDAGPVPYLIAPSCARDTSSGKRGIAGRDMVAAALDNMPASLEFSFDDPGIGLLTQSFIRAFETECDPLAARAHASSLGVILVADRAFSASFLARNANVTPSGPSAPDHKAARLGEVAFATIQGVDHSAASSAQSDSWLVTGRSVWPGWLIVLAGIATLVPGLVALRSEGVRLAFRISWSSAFAAVLYAEPEVALFAGALPNLLPPSWPRRFLVLTLVPFGLLVSAGALGFVRGRVTGSWLAGWVWALLFAGFALLLGSFGARRKAAAKSRRGKR
jgi:hypothetical protein